MSISAIEWTEQTWNPIVGCSIVSPGCTNCYAMQMASRIQKMNRTGGSNSNYVNHYDGTTKAVNGKIVWTGKLSMAPDKIFLQPLSRKAPTTYFVNSMGDLFHEDCPDEWIDRVFAVMALAPQHTFQVLTKRAARMRDYCSTIQKNGRWLQMEDIALQLGYEPRGMHDHGFDWISHKQFLPNVWLGVSTERQQEADERIRPLLDTPAAVRFISAEPLLGPIDLTRLCILPKKPGSIRAGIHINALAGKYCESGVAYTGDWDVNGPAPPVSERRKLDWVIVGGESGPGARPMHPDWARELRDQCAAAGVAFFFKQWGEWADADDYPSEMQEHLELINRADGNNVRVGKKAAGRLLDGIEHNAMPAVRA